MHEISRRTFAHQTLSSLLTFSLLKTLIQQDALADQVKPTIARWVRDLNQLGLDLKDEKLPQLEWQQRVEQLYAQVDLPELLRLIDFDQLTRNLKLPEDGPRSLPVRFPQVEGLPEDLVYGRQIFAMKKGRSVVPHGHNNMATAFLILKGRFHGRHYDRLKDEQEHCIIKPTIDRSFQPGEYSTVSDYKDNVHWFQSIDDQPAFIFNIHVLNVNPGSERRTGRLYLDPEGEPLAGGLIRAPLLSSRQARDKYGRA